MSVPASSSSISSSVNVDNILKSLNCPVELMPLAKAMHLHPCAHKVNETAIRLIQNKKCPVCRTPITASYPDHFVRNIVGMLTKDTLPEVSSKIDVEDSPYKDIPYPGKGGKFNWEGKWEQGAGIHAQHLNLTSRTPDRFLDTITISCLNDGSVEFCPEVNAKGKMLVFAQEVEIFRKYLAEVGFPESCSSVITFSFSSLSDRRQIFKILVKENEFSDEVLKMMRVLAETQDWRKELGIPQSFPRKESLRWPVLDDIDDRPFQRRGQIDDLSEALD